MTTNTDTELTPERFEERLAWAKATLDRLRAQVAEVIVGQTTVVDQVLFGLLAEGHVLLEGAPGLGKTLLVRSLATALDLTFSRIQFTADLMPSDVLGTNILLGHEGGERAFTFQKGPIFGNVVLADEINRAPPKTQSALLEAMQERACTALGTRHALPRPFFVLATQNPIEMEGTYPLPEAQLDRFLLKIAVAAPTEEEITEILARTTREAPGDVTPVVSREEMLELIALCRAVEVPTPVLAYASRLVVASHPAAPTAPDAVKKSVRFGASVRAAQSMILAAKARSLEAGRPSVSFDDVAEVASAAMAHRLVLSFDAEVEGIAAPAIVERLLAEVPRLARDARKAAGA